MLHDTPVIVWKILQSAYYIGEIIIYLSIQKKSKSGVKCKSKMYEKGIMMMITIYLYSSKGC